MKKIKFENYLKTYFYNYNNMVYCNTLDCKKNAYFGYKYKEPLKCGLHRSNDMENVKDNRCVKCLKSISPSYGYIGGEKTHCSKCKTPEMFDVTHQLCVCNKAQPSFGLEAGKATHCKECKTKEMFDVKSKICFCGRVRPNFGLDLGKATHCQECKTPEMFNVNKILCFCGRVQPTFGIEIGKATHCKECKTKEMFNVKDNKCFCGRVQPTFGIEKGKKATHCKECKTTEMIDVINKFCKMDYCDTQITTKYNGYCCRCYSYTLPDSPIVRNFKTKERLVVDYIKEEFPDYSWRFDKLVDNGCSKRRPDIYLDLGYQVIIVEVDENQHQSYDCSCENRRLMEISQDINHRPLIFLRFNPDKYYDKENKSIPSCFSITQKTGALKVNNNKKWNERLNNLKNQIDYWNKNKTDKTVEVIQLYYDEN